MTTPEVKFIGPEYDGAEDELPHFPTRLGKVIEREAGRLGDPDAVLTPTHIEITPWVIEDDRFFAVRALHKTPAGTTWPIPVLEGFFDIVTNETDALLRHRVDDEWHYKLTTVETMILSSLTRLAAANDAIHSPLRREVL